MTTTGLFLFDHDLRLHDQSGLWHLAHQVDQLICVYCLDPDWFKPNRLNSQAMGEQRHRFLAESLTDLQCSLTSLGQTLVVLQQHPVSALAKLIDEFNVSKVAKGHHPGLYEQRHWRLLSKMFPNVDFQQTDNLSLFDESDLPFNIAELPASFSQFRRSVETVQVPMPLATIQELPSAPNIDTSFLPLVDASLSAVFKGGEQAGLDHIANFFASDAPSHYKETRNALDGWQNSTKFSPWLASGCLSVRQVYQSLSQYERQHGTNASTEWIFVELLWREYFHWYACKHGARLFAGDGIRDRRTRRCFYPERYQRWCHGNTPYPLVNSLMHELNATGYMSNRGRQIVASAFVNELQLDWRYGAAYFEQQLIDFDMAVNWGNWQYIAGVGADPRGGRHFNLDKQTREYDPDGCFIDKWHGHVESQLLDSVDAADWPIMPP